MKQQQIKEGKVGHASKVQVAAIGFFAFLMCALIGGLLLYLNAHSRHQSSYEMVLGFVMCGIGFMGVIVSAVFLKNAKSVRRRVNDGVLGKGVVSKASILYKECLSKGKLIQILQEFVRDVEQHPKDHEGDEILLANQLLTTGIMEWENPPTLSCYTYATRAAKAAGADDTLGELFIPLDKFSPYTALVNKIANALNLLNAASEEMNNNWNGGVATAHVDRVAKAERDALLNVLSRTPDPFTEHLDALDAAGYESQDMSCEWAPRLRILRTFPDLRLPASCYYDLRMNHETQTALLDITVPSPDDLSFLSCNDLDDPIDLLACAYALRVSLLAGRAVFAATPVINRVVVLAHGDPTEGPAYVISSMDLTRDGGEIERLTEVFASGLLEVPTDPALRCNCNAQNGWVQVKPHMIFTDEEVAPEVRVADTMGDTTSLPPELAAAVHASTVDGLTFSPFSKLYDRHNEPEELEKAVSWAIEMEGSDTVDHQAIVELLHTALLEADFRSYADTDTQVWRWFANASDRLAYNRMHEDDTRTVRVLPNAVSTAISKLVRHARDSGQLDMALTWANEDVRTSPLASGAHDGRCSVLMEMERLHEAEEEWKAFLPVATTPFDAALALYRLAFVEWKLGHSDLAVACYSRCRHFDTPLRVQATKEAEELGKSEPSLAVGEISFVGLMKKLTEAGIDLCKNDKRCEQLLPAAVLCMDNGLFLPACGLIEALRGWGSKEVNLLLQDSLGLRDRSKEEDDEKEN